MNKQTLVVVIGAIVLLGLGVFGAMAFTGGSTSGPNGQSPTGGTHTMEDGSIMPGMDMDP